MKKVIILSFLFINQLGCKSDKIEPSNVVKPHDFTAKLIGSYTQNYEEITGTYTKKGTYKLILTKKDDNTVSLDLSNSYSTKSEQGNGQGSGSSNFTNITVVDDSSFVVKKILFGAGGLKYTIEGKGQLIGKNLQMTLVSSNGTVSDSQIFSFIKD